MSKITLSDLVNLQNETSAVTTINNNSDIVVAAFDNTISRDGSSPNTMSAPLDMNSEQIVNLPVPITDGSPLRLQDLNDFIGGGTITNIPAGGTTSQVLAKSANADYQVSWINSVNSMGLVTPAELTVTGSPLTASGTITTAWAVTPTGTGAMVKSISPTLTTPVIDTATLSNRLVKGIYILASSNVAGAPLTGSTAEATLSTIAIPANAMGANGTLRITVLARCTGTAGNKTLRVKFAGTAFMETVNGSTILAVRNLGLISNRNATNSQVGMPLGATGYGGSAIDVITSAIDTTSSQNITITGQLANGGDSVAVAQYLIELIVP